MIEDEVSIKDDLKYLISNCLYFVIALEIFVWIITDCNFKLY